MWRKVFWIVSLIMFALAAAMYDANPIATHAMLYVLTPLFIVGLYDMFQKNNNVLRNYPVVGHMRFILIGLRPEIQQYFIETNQDGMPFSDELRHLVYARAEGYDETLPFGTQRDTYQEGFAFAMHSMSPTKLGDEHARVTVGGEACTQPYDASRLNISAMSFGALSANAIRSLNMGAKIGGFAHNTGEGGLSPYHQGPGGDLFWQLGTGYFGCRTPEGNFDEAQFKAKVVLPQVRMIEIKLSQGAKPAHGGLLPGAKVDKEIATIRGIPEGKDCLSPPTHSAFSTPRELLHFVQHLRELSGGKPVGFKLCLGCPTNFMGICKAMIETGIKPDFITVDGAEGGTGAAPLEFTDFLGVPLNEALAFIHNTLVGLNLRENIRIISSGKVVSGFDMLSKMALGADMCNSARAMMFALGCIQSRRCNTNMCPTGIATQDPSRSYAVVPESKGQKVANFHQRTVESFLEVLGATGVHSVDELTPDHVFRRTSLTEILPFRLIYQFLEPGDILAGKATLRYSIYWEKASADKF
ncbi:MAG: glutamate synthase [marine bacterium B5-7]|nr:MAG: glutamate synthase [marine bacterium B5-7]